MNSFGPPSLPMPASHLPSDEWAAIWRSGLGTSLQSLRLTLVPDLFVDIISQFTQLTRLEMGSLISPPLLLLTTPVSQQGHYRGCSLEMPTDTKRFSITALPPSMRMLTALTRLQHLDLTHQPDHPLDVSCFTRLYHLRLRGYPMTLLRTSPYFPLAPPLLTKISVSLRSDWNANPIPDQRPN